MSQQPFYNENENNLNNDEDEDEEIIDDPAALPPPVPGTSIPSSRTRKRDMLKWITPGGRSSSSSSGSEMVRPIRMEDGSIIEEEENDTNSPKRQKLNFDGLFQGMPGMGSILGYDEYERQQQELQQQQQTPQTQEEEDPSQSRRQSSSDSSTNRINMDKLFEEEKRRIQENYREIINDMYEQIEEQRNQDPENVPENAEAIMRDVIRQEMDAEIKATREEFEKQKLEDYEQAQLLVNEDTEVSEESQREIQELINQDLELEKQREESQIQMDDFLKYEEEAIIRYEQSQTIDDMATSTTGNIQQPKENENLDQWALDRLQDMASYSDDISSHEVTDILDENIADLEDRIEKQAVKDSASIQPDSLKEWQMYRSIATKLNEESGGPSSGETTTSEDENEEEIAAKLQSWKAYLEKEQAIRKESGLTRGPKLPFEWHEYEDNNNDDTSNYSDSEPLTVSEKIENRRNINKLSIQAMENLINKGTGRTEELKRELESLKSQLESQNYLDVDEETFTMNEQVDDKQPEGPVDLSDVFQSSIFTERKTTTTEQQQQAPPLSPLDRDFNYRPVVGGDDTSSNSNSPPQPPNTPFFSDSFSQDTTDMGQQKQQQQQQPPDTPFFSSNSDDEIETVAAPPPNTPFFSSDDQEESAGTTSSSSDAGEDFTYNLGSVDDQKLRNMYQRAGARTKEEQDAIRSQWEEFQKFEQAKREMSGLDSNANDDSNMMNQANLNYDMSDVIKEDGDIDAEKILSSIGPRPTRQKKSSSFSSSVSSSMEESTAAAAGEEDEIRVPESNLDPVEVNDALYRSVSAVGGGRTKDDPAAKSEQQKAFTEYMNQEEELRKSLDELNKEIESEFATKDQGSSFNATEYAQEAIESLGPRPKPQRKRIIDEGGYSDMGGALANRDDDDDDEYDDDYDSSFSSDTRRTDRSSNPKSFTEEDDLIPGWLRRERESARKESGDSSSSGGGSQRGSFLGSDIDDVFDDDTYEHNQRQLAEYERRRAGNRKQMGIDISDVLGKSSDDYADYTYDDNFFPASDSSGGGGWGAASFEARKQNLLDYTELDISQVNSVMEYKDSVYATGVSKYMKRINKPFREFGAIFRLEGVLVDITGFQWEAWKIVADKYNFKPPQIDDVRRASVLPPHTAISRIFYWTDDIILCREAVITHQEALRSIFHKWMEENDTEGIEADSSSSSGSSVERSNNQGMLGIGQELFEEESEPAAARTTSVPVFSQTTSEEEKINILAEAWSKTAIEYNLIPPTLEQVMFSVALSPDLAVREAFQWSRDSVEVEKFVMSYQDNLRAMGDAAGSNDKGAAPAAPSPAPPKKRVRRLDENSMMEIQYQVWTTIAKEYGFQEPIPDEVMAAFVINDPTIAMRNGFEWTDDPTLLSELVQKYNTYSRDFVDQWTSGGDVGSNAALKVESTASVATASTSSLTADDYSLSSQETVGPSPEEVLEIQAQAWKLAVEKYGFPSPSLDQVKLAMNIPSIEAVQKVFAWTTNEEICSSISSTYELSLRDLSRVLMDKYGLKAQEADRLAFQEEIDGNDTVDGDMIFKTVADSWAAVARRFGYDEPDVEQLLFAMTVGPEEAVMTGFEWKRKDEFNDVARIVNDYKNELQGKRAALGLSNTDSQTGGSPMLLQPKRNVQQNTEKIFQAVFDAWTAVARKFGYDLPDEEQIIFAMSVGPEDAIANGFRWSDNPDVTAKLLMEYKNELHDKRAALLEPEEASGDSYISDVAIEASYIEDNEEIDEEDDISIPPFEVMPGAAEWVKSLLDVEMSCGVVSYLEKDQVEILLKQANMLDLIDSDKRVTASNNYRRDQDQLLGAALRVERRPDHCVVFDSSSLISDAAHEVEMRSVSIIGPFPRYDLLSADSTAGSFTDLTAMNIRRLFGERIYDQPQMDIQRAEPDQNRKTKTRFFWDDDI